MTSSKSIQSILVLIFALVASVWLGVSVVTQQTETLAKVVGITLLLIGVLLGQRIWLLYIFFAALNIPIIRGIGTGELGQMMMIGFCILMFFMRRFRSHWKFDELDLWRVVIILLIVQVYFRNPVGLNIFGAGAVGARPYFDATLSVLAGFFLSKMMVNPKEIKWAMWLNITGTILSAPLGYLRGSGLQQGSSMPQLGVGFEGEAAGRNASLNSSAILIARYVSSKISPLKAAFHPLWAPLILFGLAIAALSGYRNVVANVGLIYLAGIAYRGGFISVVISMFCGALMLGGLALLNLAHPLPANLQRALSPFPGTWEERYVKGAEDSTEWRIEMWKEALFTDYWIQNKILGDGLGLTRLELQRLEAMEDMANYTTVSGLTVQQEAMMVTGGYHSGPVQTVRAVGYVGLFLLLLAMIRNSVHTHRQIKRCRGTEWYPIVLFFGIPIVIYPIFFVFIFGEFGSAVAFFFLGSGVLTLIKNNLPLEPYTKNAAATRRCRK